MAWKHVTLRKRFFGQIFGSTADPVHGHGMEYFIDITGILVSIAFVVGSYCFMSADAETVTIGDWLFIGGSLANIAVCTHTLLEQLHAMKGKLPLKDHDRDELKESLLYLISSIGYAVGCIFFMPGLVDTAAAKLIVAGLGAWFCVISSFMVVSAVLYNAMGYAADKSEHGIDPQAANLCKNFNRAGMFLLLFGGVLFVCGSFMYRTVFGGRCPPRSTDATCMAVASYGTCLYLAGSYCFLVQTIMTFIAGIVKHSSELRDRETLSETSKLVA